VNTATLRVGTWNILGRRRNEVLELADDGAVSATLAEDPVDVLCLQEVHFYGGSADEQLRAELRTAGLNHFVGKALSPSHLDARAELGICIAARFPLRNPYAHRLNNPGLRRKVRGADWVLHDKGLVGAELKLGDGCILKIYSLHLFPFFEFGVDDDDAYVDHMWSELWKFVDKKSNGTRTILAGDYNQAGRVDAAKAKSHRSWNFCASEEVTTRFGLSLDDIAIDWSAPPVDPKVVKTFSDHHLVIADLVLSPDRR
jgi:endonuclease/exonuclease/phosphatase family metal-dependent hydrolase